MNKPAHDFVFRKAKIKDLPELVDFLAKLALHVSGEPPQKLKKREVTRLKAALRNAPFYGPSEGRQRRGSRPGDRSGSASATWCEPVLLKIGI